MGEKPTMSFIEESQWIWDQVTTIKGLPLQDKLELAALIIRTPNPEILRIEKGSNIHFTPSQIRTIQVFVEDPTLTDKELAARLHCGASNVRHLFMGIRDRIQDSDPHAEVDSRITLYFWLRDNVS